MATPGRDEWMKSVQQKYEPMVEDGILKAVDATQLKAEGKHPITSTCTWTM